MAQAAPSKTIVPRDPTAARRRWAAAMFLIAGILIGILLTLAGQSGWTAWKARQASGATFLAANKAQDKAIAETASGLQYKILEKGTGDARPTDSDVVLVTYEGKLTDGTTFDRSEQPTPLPVAGVVPGFSEALKLMPKGSKYRFWIKPSLGYGDKAAGPIPANSVLVFDVKLLDFLPEAVIRQMQQQMGMQSGGAPGGTENDRTRDRSQPGRQ
ncbi:FKBP-type peptidyl-prolyl cis-trans isomerase [Sphingomonas sp. DT-204]|uniref:FKBP-type peptidyl-prolyl cis-trans isomerase n=1 Tax=Sphingomonas sp. DT-204 TaxID=3396166 RepID=UPI003F1CAD23